MQGSSPTTRFADWESDPARCFRHRVEMNLAVAFGERPNWWRMVAWTVSAVGENAATRSTLAGTVGALLDRTRRDAFQIII